MIKRLDKIVESFNDMTKAKSEQEKHQHEKRFITQLTILLVNLIDKSHKHEGDSENVG
jgi:hypothetical protein